MRNLIIRIRLCLRHVAARTLVARSFAIIGAGVALLSGAQPAAADKYCSGSEIVEFVTKEGIVGWVVGVDKSPQCAFPSLVVVMDLIEADQKVHKFSFTLQYDANKRQLVKALGIEPSGKEGYFPNLVLGGDRSKDKHSFVLSHHHLLGDQVKITQVKMFAAFAGRASCRYEGAATVPGTPSTTTHSRDGGTNYVSARTPETPIITDCRVRRSGDGRRPRPK